MLKSALIDGLTVSSFVTHEDGAILYNYAKRAKKGIVEIGSAFGKSAIYLAQGSMDGNKVPVYCIDPWTFATGQCTNNFDDPVSKMYLSINSIHSSFLHNTRRLKDLIKPIIGRSEEIAETFKEEFDVLFIDGDHDYDQVKLDWDLWGSKIKDGTILFHDIAKGIPCDGPRRIFDTIDSLGHLTSEFGNLGVVTVKPGGV